MTLICALRLIYISDPLGYIPFQQRICVDLYYVHYGYKKQNAQSTKSELFGKNIERIANIPR